MIDMLTTTLTDDELYELTHSHQGACQLRRLHDAGFARARIIHGRVVLERRHYDAVCQGSMAESKPEPRVKSFREIA